MGCTYKFFESSVSYINFYLAPSILCLLIMLLLPCTFSSYSSLPPPHWTPSVMSLSLVLAVWQWWCLVLFCFYFLNVNYQCTTWFCSLFSLVTFGNFWAITTASNTPFSRPSLSRAHFAGAYVRLLTMSHMFSLLFYVFSILLTLHAIILFSLVY